MSWPAVGWALAQKAPSSAAKFLLVMLADSASVGDWLAWPSVAYLSEATQQDRKTVLTNLQKLLQCGLIAPSGKTGRTGQIVIWKLSVTAPDKRGKHPKTGTVSDQETIPVFPRNSTNFPSEEYQKRDTEPVIEPVKEPKKRERAKRAARSPVECSIPDGFQVSDAVQAWAKAKGFDRLNEHLEAFTDKAKARSYQYVDWDAAFKRAIREDWAGLRDGKKPRRPALLASNEPEDFHVPGA